MKYIYLLILITVSSCIQKTTQESATISLSEEVLVQRALTSLNINESNTSFVVSKISPSNAKETIIVIPEVVNEEEDMYELNSTILLVDNTTGKITHKFFESSKENGWVSDAIFIDRIVIDTLNYKLNASKNAFGITMHVRNGSQPNPYNHKSMSLFTKDKNSLKKVLDAYTIYEDSGIVNVNVCYSDFTKKVNVLSVSDSKTNGNYDILVDNTVSQINYRTDKQGECKPREHIISAEKCVLKFNGGTYKVTQVVKTDISDIMSIQNLQKSFIAKNEVEFLEQFPKDYEQFRSYFGWNSTNDAPEALYDDANAYIDYWFDLLNKEAYKVHEPEITGICYDGSWRADAVNYFQNKSISYIKEKEVYHLINNLSNEDAKSILFFLFDGPAPKFDDDFASNLSTSKQNILNEVFKTMLFDQDDIDESDNQDDEDLVISNFSFYKNNDAYFIKDIDVNSDGIPDKIVSSERYQGEDLLLFVSNNNIYEFALKTTNFSQDGGSQIYTIKKNANGFVIITAFPGGGFLETHHYVSFENDRWVLTHTVYKTSVNRLDTSLIYVCDVKQSIDLSNPNLLQQLNAIPEESDRAKVCVQQRDSDRDNLKDENIQTVKQATIDSVSLNEIKGSKEEELPTIYDYYRHEKIDEVAIWSDKLFGRCCTEADLMYSELLEFEITANLNEKKYPFSNLSDRSYSTAFVFKEHQNIEIYLKVNGVEEHKYHTELELDDVLKSTDTLLKPFRLSLVNGYVKSEKIFKENGRVKTLKVFLNSNYKGTIELLDTPLVQEFEFDFMFTKDDVVKLVPISFYKGTKYKDVCISEIQSSLAHITHPSINKKYKVRELWERGNAVKD